MHAFKTSALSLLVLALSQSRTIFAYPGSGYDDIYARNIDELDSYLYARDAYPEAYPEAYAEAVAYPYAYADPEPIKFGAIASVAKAAGKLFFARDAYPEAYAEAYPEAYAEAVAYPYAYADPGPVKFGAIASVVKVASNAGKVENKAQKANDALKTTSNLMNGASNVVNAGSQLRQSISGGSGQQQYRRSFDEEYYGY
jgi:hypothetical protein